MVYSYIVEYEYEITITERKFMADCRCNILEDEVKQLQNKLDFTEECINEFSESSLEDADEISELQFRLALKTSECEYLKKSLDELEILTTLQKLQTIILKGIINEKIN